MCDVEDDPGRIARILIEFHRFFLIWMVVFNGDPAATKKPPRRMEPVPQFLVYGTQVVCVDRKGARARMTASLALLVWMNAVRDHGGSAGPFVVMSYALPTDFRVGSDNASAPPRRRADVLGHGRVHRDGRRQAATVAGVGPCGRPTIPRGGSG